MSVLFVCMGNICRSPTAAAVFRNVVEREGLSGSIRIDSAGTHAYHVGDGADRRARRAAAGRGFDLDSHRARRVDSSDFSRFDYVIAMDRDNYFELQSICPEGAEERLSMFLQFAPHLGVDEVPDPYYGGVSGFDHVLDLVEAASEGLLADIQARVPGVGGR